ncbi:unnamed protein product, partial [Iphiclides podalirius]
MLTILLLFPSVWCEGYWSPASEEGLDGRLLQIHVVYSHGHMAPQAFYPEDPHASSAIWSNGPLELTVLGKKQGFRLGQALRSRYGTLLPKARAWKAVKAISSDTTRTLMTSAALLAGLIPPSADDIWSNIAWPPSAVHSSPAEYDRILAPRIQCSLYEHVLKRTPSRDDDETRMLYRLLTKYTGELIASPMDLLYLYTCLEIEKQAGLRIPKWTRRIYGTMKRHVVSSLRHSTESLELKRLRSGPLISVLTGYKNDSYNIHLYCTHDTVVSALMDSLGFELSAPPGFTSAFIVEYRELAGEVFTQIWYRQGAESELSRLQLPGCDVRCPLNELRRVVQPLIPRDWTEECSVRKQERDQVHESIALHRKQTQNKENENYFDARLGDWIVGLA